MGKKTKKFDEGGMATDPNWMPSTTPEVPPAAAGRGPSPDQIKAAMAMALATQGTMGAIGGMGGMGNMQQQGRPVPPTPAAYKKGGAVKKFARGGGIEVRGKTRGRIC